MNILILSSSSLHFPLDVKDLLTKAGHESHRLDSLSDFIASPLRRKPFLGILELGTTEDIERALIAYEWVESAQPEVPVRWLLLVGSKHIPWRERAGRFRGVEIAELPLPSKNILFKIELQLRLLKAEPEKSSRAPQGFLAEFTGAAKDRVMVLRGPGPREGSWQAGENTPQGKTRWRWVKSDKKAAVTSSDFVWSAETGKAPQYNEVKSAWEIKDPTADLVCYRGPEKIFSAVQSIASQNAEEKSVSVSSGPAPELKVVGETGGAADNSSEKISREEPRGGPESKRFLPDATQGREKEKTSGQNFGNSESGPSAHLAQEKNQREEGSAGRKDAPAVERDERSKNSLASSASENSGPSHTPRSAENIGKENPVRGKPESSVAAATGTAREERKNDPTLSARNITQKNTDNPSSPPSPSKENLLAAAAEHTSREREKSGSAPPVKSAAPAAEKSTTSPADQINAAGLAGEIVEETERTGETYYSPRDEENPISRKTALQRKLESFGLAHLSEKIDKAQGKKKESGEESPAGRATTNQTIGPGHGTRETKKDFPAQPQKKSSPGEIPANPTANEEGHVRIEAASAKKDSGTITIGSRQETNHEPRSVSGENRAPAEAGEYERKSRYFVTRTLQELHDKNSIWYPVDGYRIYLSADHRYYGFKSPAELFPLWVYEGELAPEFLEQTLAWKFYDRPPASYAELESLPEPIQRYLQDWSGVESGPEKMGPRESLEKKRLAAAPGKERTPKAEAPPAPSSFSFLAFLRKLFGIG